MMKINTIKTRVTLGIWLTTLLVFVSAVSLSVYLIYRYVESLSLERIRAEEAVLESQDIIDAIARSPFPELRVLLQGTLEALHIHEIVRVYRADGKLIFTNFPQPEIDASIVNRLQYVNRGAYVIKGNSREYLARLKSYLTLDQEEVWFEVATPRPNILSVVRAYIAPFLGILFLGLLFSLLVASWVAVRSFESLESFAAIIDGYDVKEAKTWQPLELENFPGDFQRIVGKFNELLTRVQQSLIQSQKLGQYIAHEVRTPLTIIQGEIETAFLINNVSPELKKKLESIEEEIDRIDRIVKTLLQKALQERGKSVYEPRPIDLVRLIENEKPRLERWGGRSLSVKMIEPNIPMILADEELLFLMLSNLIRNVQKHADSDAQIEIRIAMGVDREVNLSVCDSGGRVSDSEIRSLENAKVGDPVLGLGLTLTKQICELSRLKISFLRAQLGGLEVRLSLPSIA